MLGLYGLISYVTLRKRKKSASAKYLGPQSQAFCTCLARVYRHVLLAFVVAAPLSYVPDGSWLQSFVYRIEISWWMLALGASLSMAVLIDNRFQIIKTAMANPVNSFKIRIVASTGYRDW